ncbi:hypothetical protein EPUS_04346 [Endocarpon pusillum Z07020]|uniref:UBC core domain-containing protein n=1 Tax=Endocarpon pusillum (strain Z07020 / HMAS-L-300199) TaxID=1263415 RepID=U1I2R5_ENDPU|nr:uncharacterized protein EPUS_04346 [Endocarpon pusillum Z07020]ERF76269.1 hypothetical protein EPUS_04346 [Endocarpon pusillum Z07020]
MAQGSQKRITKELSELTSSPPAGITVSLADESDLLKWKVTMEGPADSPYAGGTFHLLLTLPPQYPFRPPTLTFTTKVYHPNISSGPTTANPANTPGITTPAPAEAGVMCLGILKPEEWKPSTKIAAVLGFARQLLREPNPDDAVEGRIAEELRRDRAAWEKEARDWTKRYAMKK